MKQRGPFISIADFITRRLVNPPSSSGSETAITKTGIKGALQSAIDGTSINHTTLSCHEIDKIEDEMGGSFQSCVDREISLTQSVF